MSRERTDVRGDYPCVTIRCDTPGCDEVTDVLVGGGDIDATVEARLDRDGWTEERIDTSTFTGPDRFEYVHRCPDHTRRAAARDLPRAIEPEPGKTWQPVRGRIGGVVH